VNFLLISTGSTGFSWFLGEQKITSRLFVSQLLADSVGRAPLQGLMQFNARLIAFSFIYIGCHAFAAENYEFISNFRFGCSYCVHDESGHNFTFDPNSRPPMRTNMLLRQQMCSTTTNAPDGGSNFGVIAKSPLMALRYFDVVIG